MKITARVCVSKLDAPMSTTIRGKLRFLNEMSMVLTREHPDNCQVSLDEEYADFLRTYGISVPPNADDIPEADAVDYAYRLFNAMAVLATCGAMSAKTHIITYGAVSITSESAEWSFSDTATYDGTDWSFPLSD